MLAQDVTLATAIWKKTYPYMLGANGLFARNMARLNVDFRHYIVAVNNGVPLGVLQQYWHRTWVRYIDSDVAARRAAKLYQIENIEDGFWYSAGPLTAIVSCKTPWLLYIADDVELVDSMSGWIMAAITEMDLDRSILNTSPLWHKERDELVAEHPDNHLANEYVLTRGFSDHCFLIRTADFQRDIYNVRHTESDVLYQVDGAFEKRVGAYSRSHNMWRQVTPYARWAHEPFAATGRPRPAPTI